MSDYYYDILEPDENLEIASDNFNRIIGRLYYQSYEANKRAVYNKPFDLNVQGLTGMWFTKLMKVFIVYDRNNQEVGFLAGMCFRPMSYNAALFQIEDWYVEPGHEAALAGLFDHVLAAVRILGIDEIIVNDSADRTINFGPRWKKVNSFKMDRYVKA